MNILKPSSIEEYIVSLLQREPLSGGELLEKIKLSRPRTTKQALYAALRKLKSDEIVVMHAMRISLSSVWVNNMTSFFNRAKHFYTKTVATDEGFLNLEDGDRVTYSFKNPHITDIFWGHAFDLLSEITPISQPVFLYNPHEWFMLARPETEKALFEKISQSGRKLFLLAGGTTFLDRIVSKEFNRTTTNYYSTNETLFEKRNYYCNVFDDFIIEAHLDEVTTQKIDSFYQETTAWDIAAQEKLKTIIKNEGKNKLVISRSKRRAAKLKKIFQDRFHISR